MLTDTIRDNKKERYRAARMSLRHRAISLMYIILMVRRGYVHTRPLANQEQLGTHKISILVIANTFSLK